MTEATLPAEDEALQFNNPSAPNYDWQKDREWFNQRLANSNIRNSELAQQVSKLRKQLADINKTVCKKIRVESPRKLEKALDYATGGDACESYRLGVEEAQEEIIGRIQKVLK